MNRDNLPIEHFFFTEPNLEKILENLDVVRQQIHPVIPDEELNVEQNFPSVCLVGLGRCGSNIALEVATLVYNARTSYLHEVEYHEKQAQESDLKSLNWIRKKFSIDKKSSSTPLFLIEPIVMLGDLDKDIEGRIRFSSQAGRAQFLEAYRKLQIMDLSEVHAGGAGNAPILGQYLAKIILNKDTSSFRNDSWRHMHSYLVDSCGIKANQSRLYFYIFSAGGGTGSGMASEFGLAQQFSYLSKTFDYRAELNKAVDKRHSFVFEPIFTSGICILPNISGKDIDISEALHINAGRLLTKYVSEEWDFSYNEERDNDEDPENVMQRIRPWNSMMLISNDIMRYAEEEDGNDVEDIDVNTMEKYANQYISQQIFNILTAQAVTTDYDEDYFRRAGIDIAETIRLDANDLFMSLAGPVAVAYAESVVRKKGPMSEVDIDDLFCRSIELPHFNDDTSAIEGISVLPVESERYRNCIQDYRKSQYDSNKLNNLHFFKNCSSIVSIISVPRDFKLSFTAMNRLKVQLNRLFPNTTLKRYALVIGASANLSLTTLIAKSPCLSDDFLTLMVSYMKRCFARDEYRYNDEIDKAIIGFIQGDVFDEEEVEKYFLEYENPAKILDTNWYAIKPMYEKKYRELIEDSERFVSINDIRLDMKNVKNAIKYLREIYRHRISKTNMLSLN
ncbi:hypothetical protein MSP8887_01521 [Marinomonas spartinae]|uniref:Uncharacterized protein n=1 Tax=Marinomonas spartinae TaxID=1792290 RepID=A0A1A8TST9_9GAMM|nr:hypothetical protein [Marinomonas spartinae]SBS31456.1 hypothetical protein MSP8887_01521 [Marinomonas spartinae]SBS37849.1 hypothetical protein MSP8886_04289 [Marinomonas spartinae]